MVETRHPYRWAVKACPSSWSTLARDSATPMATMPPRLLYCEKVPTKLDHCRDISPSPTNAASTIPNQNPGR